jgi:SAM-dependent methyltransferase
LAQVRTEGYRDAMLGNGELFKGKVVLDVGCGTGTAPATQTRAAAAPCAPRWPWSTRLPTAAGILSMFAANAGARLVIGVDASSIIEQAREVVARNGLAEKVTLVRGFIDEKFQLPDGLPQAQHSIDAAAAGASRVCRVGRAGPGWAEQGTEREHGASQVGIVVSCPHVGMASSEHLPHMAG